MPVPGWERQDQRQALAPYCLSRLRCCLIPADGLMGSGPVVLRSCFAHHCQGQGLDLLQAMVLPSCLAGRLSNTGDLPSIGVLQVQVEDILMVLLSPHRNALLRILPEHPV